MGIPWDGMGWDGTEKYVPWTSLDIIYMYITVIMGAAHGFTTTPSNFLYKSDTVLERTHSCASF